MNNYKTDDEKEWGLTFGAKLRNAIETSRFTQAEVADKIGVSRQIFSRYIHGNAIPSVYKARQIANILGCTIDELIESKCN